MSVLGILGALFAVAAIFGSVSRRWLRLPITVGTTLLTLVVSSGLMLVPSMHNWMQRIVQHLDFSSLVLHGMLPLLLFSGAFSLDLEELAREKLPVAVLAILGTVASFFLVAFLLAVSCGHRLAWVQCLLFGALISPTDPIAVLEMLRRVGASSAVRAQLSGESLFNDGVGAVLFFAVLAAAHGEMVPAGRIAQMALAGAVGGVLLGVAGGWTASRLMRPVDAHSVDVLYTVALALGGYFLAEQWHVSAPLEAVTAGLALRYFNRHQPSCRIAHEPLDRFWESLDEVQNSILFLLLGLEAVAVRIDVFTGQIGFTAIVLVNAVRFALVFLLLGLLQWIRRREKIPVLVLGWGGLRGGLSIALALTVPAALGGAWMVGATYVVVLFSILVQGGSMNWLLQVQNRRAPRNR